MDNKHQGGTVFLSSYQLAKQLIYSKQGFQDVNAKNAKGFAWFVY